MALVLWFIITFCSFRGYNYFSLGAHLRNKSLMDRLQDYEQLKEENEYLDMENDEQAKNYVNLRKGQLCIILYHYQ